jgi:hypothetical protein
LKKILFAAMLLLPVAAISQTTPAPTQVTTTDKDAVRQVYPNAIARLHPKQHPNDPDAYGIRDGVDGKWISGEKGSAADAWRDAYKRLVLFGVAK